MQSSAIRDAVCSIPSRLADVDLDVLDKIVKGGVAQVKKTWPVTAA